MVNQLLHIIGATIVASFITDSFQDMMYDREWIVRGDSLILLADIFEQFVITLLKLSHDAANHDDIIELTHVKRALLGYLAPTYFSSPLSAVDMSQLSCFGSHRDAMNNYIRVMCEIHCNAVIFVDGSTQIWGQMAAFLHSITYPLATYLEETTTNSDQHQGFPTIRRETGWETFTHLRNAFSSQQLDYRVYVSPSLHREHVNITPGHIVHILEKRDVPLPLGYRHNMHSLGSMGWAPTQNRSVSEEMEIVKLEYKLVLRSMDGYESEGEESDVSGWESDGTYSPSETEGDYDSDHMIDDGEFESDSEESDSD